MASASTFRSFPDVADVFAGSTSAWKDPSPSTIEAHLCLLSSLPTMWVVLLYATIICYEKQRWNLTDQPSNRSNQTLFESRYCNAWSQWHSKNSVAPLIGNWSNRTGNTYGKPEKIYSGDICKFFYGNDSSWNISFKMQFDFFKPSWGHGWLNKRRKVHTVATNWPAPLNMKTPR